MNRSTDHSTRNVGIQALPESNDFELKSSIVMGMHLERTCRRKSISCVVDKSGIRAYPSESEVLPCETSPSLSMEPSLFSRSVSFTVDLVSFLSSDMDPTVIALGLRRCSSHLRGGCPVEWGILVPTVLAILTDHRENQGILDRGLSVLDDIIVVCCTRPLKRRHDVFRSLSEFLVGVLRRREKLEHNVLQKVTALCATLIHEQPTQDEILEEFAKLLWSEDSMFAQRQALESLSSACDTEADPKTRRRVFESLLANDAMIAVLLIRQTFLGSSLVAEDAARLLRGAWITAMESDTRHRPEEFIALLDNLASNASGMKAVKLFQEILDCVLACMLVHMHDESITRKCLSTIRRVATDETLRTSLSQKDCEAAIARVMKIYMFNHVVLADAFASLNNAVFCRRRFVSADTLDSFIAATEKFQAETRLMKNACLFMNTYLHFYDAPAPDICIALLQRRAIIASILAKAGVAHSTLCLRRALAASRRLDAIVSNRSLY